MKVYNWLSCLSRGSFDVGKTANILHFKAQLSVQSLLFTQALPYDLSAFAFKLFRILSPCLRGVNIRRALVVRRAEHADNREQDRDG